MSNYNSTLQSNNTDLQAILNTINELPEAVEQATPVISVNTSGLITATAGTKSSTYQLAFQPAKTITPSTASQIAVSSEYYTGGNVTVAGDANLVADNIKSGVSIFGVNGNYEGNGGDTSAEDRLVDGTISVYTNNRITSIDRYKFYNCQNLTSVSFPRVTSIGSWAFCSCHNLASVSFPVATSIGWSAFLGCSNLTTANFPAATFTGSDAFYNCISLSTASFPVAKSIGWSAFYNCISLTSVSFPVATSIGNSAFKGCQNLTAVSFPVVAAINRSAFYGCSSLSAIYLNLKRICTLSASDAFSGTLIQSDKGSIFVPSSLVSRYKSATNWTFFSARIYSM